MAMSLALDVVRVGVIIAVLSHSVAEDHSLTYNLHVLPPEACNGNVGQSEQYTPLLQQLQPAVQRCHEAGISGYTSCQEVIYCAHQTPPSGYYGIKFGNGRPRQMYCDMEGVHCGGGAGWMRVAYVDMTQPGGMCPQGLTTLNYFGLTLCGAPIANSAQCASTIFSSAGVNYTSVCGRVRGYSYKTPDGFHRYITSNTQINGPYVDGVSITYGSPRNHIWTYAAGRLDQHVINECPCNSFTTATAPPYVGNSYYCESGSGTSDILWDGQGCAADESPCCTHSDLPWFIRNLGVTTNDDVEVRACRDQSAGDENVPLDIIELYIR